MDLRNKIHIVDYSIEYAHIYTDQLFGKEQKRGIEELQNVIGILKRLGKRYVLTVLVDEYNPIRHRLNIKKFLDKLASLNAQPDFVGFESQLVPDKDLLMQEINKKTKREYENYIQKHKKIPCSFLIALWYLKRLGLLKIRGPELDSLKEPSQPFVAKKIITILPRKYQAVEMKALKIIEATRFKRYLENILNIFFG